MKADRNNKERGGRLPALLDKGKKVIDLSGDFRLADADEYETWYKKPHTAPELLDTAVYGLPEVFGDAVKNAALIANPGCYPTCVILAGAPLIAAGLGFPENMIADCLSGISGAGRKPTACLLPTW